jgi:hypothetical protein
MEEKTSATHCQIQCLPGLFEEYARIPQESIPRKIRLAIRRSLTAHQTRSIKTKSGNYLDGFLRFLGIKAPLPMEDPPSSSFKPGDLVRVRSREEIEATLNIWHQYKGCMFMPDAMERYCGTLQRVFKPMERFVDERDYYVKKTHGIILLQGIHCEGSRFYGRCDRACFSFWREEWLEKIEENDPRVTGRVEKTE